MNKTRNAVSRSTILSMVFKLTQSAENRWLRLRGFSLLADVIDGVTFVDGIKQEPDIHDKQNRIVA